MRRNEFDAITIALQGSFGRAIPAATKDRTWERVQFIPSEYVRDVIERIEDTKDTLPTNLGKALLEAWHAVDSGARHGEKQRGCSQCDGDGWIQCFLKTADGSVTTCVAQCKACYPNAPNGATRQSLREAGYLVCPTEERGEQAKWWVAYLRTVTSKQNPSKSGGKRAHFADLIQNPTRMAAAVEPVESRQAREERTAA